MLAKSDSAFSSPALKEEREGRGRSMGVRSLNNTLVLTNTQVCWFSHERESFHTFFFANPVPILFTLPFDFRLLKAKPLRCRVQLFQTLSRLHVIFLSLRTISKHDGEL